MQITTRTKIAVRYTTAPADMGHDGRKTSWRTDKAYLITSPAKALDFEQRLKRVLGGADYAISFRAGAREISRDELASIVMAPGCRP